MLFLKDLACASISLSNHTVADMTTTTTEAEASSIFPGVTTEPVEINTTAATMSPERKENEESELNYFCYMSVLVTYAESQDS